MNWYELRLRPDADPAEIYSVVPDGVIYHHFWDEPWWPHAYVVRVCTDDTSWFADLAAVDHFEPWDASQDAELFGPAWPNVSAFFMVASSISNQDPRMVHKLVHCMLNARGMSELDEAKFAASFLWGRLTIKLKWRLYLRRRWLRKRQKAGAAA